jgi:hypothetical protein
MELILASLELLVRSRRRTARRRTAPLLPAMARREWRILPRLRPFNSAIVFAQTGIARLCRSARCRSRRAAGPCRATRPRRCLSDRLRLVCSGLVRRPLPASPRRLGGVTHGRMRNPQEIRQRGPSCPRGQSSTARFRMQSQPAGASTTLHRTLAGVRRARPECRRAAAPTGPRESRR